LLKLRTKIAGIALLCAAFDGSALTLGGVSGVALLGQPLDLVVQVQLDVGEVASALCFDAEVFHAETRQDAGQVRVAVETIAQSQSVNVRVTSSALVDEPMVTLNLRSGCGQKMTRRYVLLADLPTQVTLSSSLLGVPSSVPAALKTDWTPLNAVAGSPPALASATGAMVAPSPAQGKSVATPKTESGKRTEPRRRAGSGASVPPKRVASDGDARPVRTVRLPRLQLDPLEVLSDRIGNLDSYMTFAPSEDALLNIEKMKTLEAQVKALRDAAVRNERSLADLQASLQKAQAERFPGALMVVLAAAVLLCMLVVAWLWSRQYRSSAAGHAWWSDAAANQEPLATEAARAALAGVASTRAKTDRSQELGAARPASLDAGNSSGLDAHSVQLGESAFPDFEQSDEVNHESRNRAESPELPAGSQAKLVRSLNSDTVLELRRRAENFVSLGKPEIAVAILRKQVSESDEPNPFVYLDLLGLFHSLGLKNDFQQLSQDFNLLFNGRVPEFAFFKDEGQGLESYPDVISRITALWPSPRVLEVIEACVFRDPWAAGSEPFDLAAMRDLLLLHAVAQNFVLAGVSAPGQPVFDNSAGSDGGGGEHVGADFDFADSVASSFPELSKSAMADLLGQGKRPAPALDLDLSDFDFVESSARMPPVADIDLARLLPGDREAPDRPVVDTGLADTRSTPAWLGRDPE
jgi:hypothetical protein